MSESKATKTPKTSRVRVKKPPQGWGGPPKGAGRGSARYVFKSAGPGKGNYSLKGEGRLERRARHAEEAMALYYGVMKADDIAVDLRLTAATHLLNRVEGLPVQKVMAAMTDPIDLMSDEELAAEEGRIEAQLAERRARTQ